jgi:adenosylmethionine-8-amino-7-oxononanoate aminotransferase
MRPNKDTSKPGIPGVFVAGTDTDAGKTVATAALLRALVDRGLPAIAFKPIQTGCIRETDGSLVAPDARVYEEAAPGAVAPCTYAFIPACSPHLAAREAGERISLERIAHEVEIHQAQGHIPIVEGAGGVRVPMGDGLTSLDLMKRLGLPVLLVAPNRLGTLNHCLLSLDALRTAGLDVLGVVLMHLAPEDSSRESQAILRDNAQALAEYGRVEVLAELPFSEALHSSDAETRYRAWGDLSAHLGAVADRIASNRKSSDDDLPAFDRNHIWHPYTSATDPLPVYPVESAQGVRLRLRDGRSLVDGMSSWWCAIHGYNHPALNEALREQSARMSHVMFGGLTHEPAVALARRLLALAPEPLDRVFFSDSGSVAVEVAIKMALQFWQAQGEPHRTRLLTVRGGYHGDTFGCMSVCDPATGMHHLFADVLPKQLFVERPSCRFDAPFEASSLDAMGKALDESGDSVAAVILEPIVQGAGGMWFYHPDYLAGVRRLCDVHGTLLILDEIATGFGRTGKMFGCHWAGIAPDIMTVGKALTGGTMTLAATLATRRVAEGISSDGGVFMHGPTFMGNPLACAVASASLDLLATGEWSRQVGQVERWLREGLEPCRGLDGVADVRVLGAIGVVEMESPVDVAKIQAFFAEQGVWIRPFARLIYLMPPYIVDEEDVRLLTRFVEKAIRERRY